MDLPLRATRVGRLTYLFAARYINSKLAGKVVLLTNSDIGIAGGITCATVGHGALPHRAHVGLLTKF